MSMNTLLEYKCPACGGALSFDSGLQKMKCPYCDTEFEVEALQELDEALGQEKPSDFTWESQPEGLWSEEETQNLRSYICESCGGEIVGDLSTAATRCPYCDNPVVMAGQFTGDLRPDLVVPFMVSKEQAKAALQQHFSKKPLLPKLFKSQNRIESIQGIYVPFWLFNTDVEANIRYKATRIHHWSDANYNYTRTSFYSLLRGGKIAFDNVPVDGSTKMANDLMESIEPYDLSQAVDFQTAYLAGYLADKYDVEAEVCKTRANQRIQSSTESSFAGTTVGYATVIPEHTNVQLHGGNVRYGLLPAWILTTRWQDKLYTFAMNGQTGKMTGAFPVCPRRSAAWFAGVCAGVTAIAHLVQMLL